MKKSLTVGDSSFVTAIENGNYYVDKTAHIRDVMESGNFVDVITRPRRFGKTYFLDTLKTFLSAQENEAEGVASAAKLFAGLKISENKAFCDRYMGRTPVLFLSFKGVEETDFQKACGRLARKVAVAAQEFNWLSKSPKLNDFDKQRLLAYQTIEDAPHERRVELIPWFAADMLAFLAKYFGRQAVLLIDEYDVPLAKAAQRGYYDEMCVLMRGFLSVLKPEDGPRLDGKPVLGKAVLTGCLRVSKESIFTDVNNLTVNTVCSQNAAFSSVMGFTEDEVDGLLDYYGLQGCKDVLRRWYDGYRFGSQEIYCPWDVVNYCAEALKQTMPAKTEPKNYWLGTSGNDVIDEFLAYLSDEDAGRMQELLDGGTAEVEINEQLTYADFVNHKSDDFWTLLLFCGYLTVGSASGEGRYQLRIPNEEIRQTFRRSVQERYSALNDAFAGSGRKLAEAALSGDTETMAGVLEPLLRNYVSVRDAAGKAPAENYYHGFLAALLSSAGRAALDFRSNAEAGDGYADLAFASGRGAGRTGVVIEIKRVQRPQDMLKAVDDALGQIDGKRYADCLHAMRCRQYYTYGIAFCGKNCEVGGGMLRSVKDL